MAIIAPLKTIEQLAIAKKIKDLLKQLPLADKREIEGEVSRSISEELAAKKALCGKNKTRWTEILKESGFIPQEAEKRIKLVKVPGWAWTVGTLMAVQLARPTYNDMLDDLLMQEVITQDAAKAQMDKVQAQRKLERVERIAQKKLETESEFLKWGKNIYGKRVLNIVEIPEAAGNSLEQMLVIFKKAADSPVEFPMFANELVNICQESERWMEIEALAEIKNLESTSIPLSQVCPGTRVRILGKHPLSGQAGTVTSEHNGNGWTVTPDSNDAENRQSVWVGTPEIEAYGYSRW